MAYVAVRMPEVFDPPVPDRIHIRSPTHTKGRIVILSFLRCSGDAVPLDDLLDVIERFRPDPYREIEAAVVDGLVVVEFGPPTPGSTLRSVLLKRL